MKLNCNLVCILFRPEKTISRFFSFEGKEEQQENMANLCFKALTSVCCSQIMPSLQSALCDSCQGSVLFRVQPSFKMELLFFDFLL